jgi:PAS domain S-box-containing protein
VLISHDHPIESGERHLPRHTSKKTRGWLDVSGARMCLLDIAGGWVNIMLSMILFAGEDTARRVLFEAGHAETFSSTAIKNGLLERTLNGFKEAVNIFSEAGFGDFVIRELDFNGGFVSLTCRDTFEAWALLHNKRYSETPVCHYSTGVLLSFMENVSGRSDLISVETKCIANGSEECEFVIGTAAALKHKGVIRPEWGMTIREKAQYLETLLSEKERIEKALTKKNIELSALNKISGAVGYSLDLKEILDLAVDELSKILVDKGIGIYLLDRNRKELIYTAQKGFSAGFFKKVSRLKMGEGVAGKVAREGFPMTHLDKALYPPGIEAALKKEKICAILSVPLINKEEVVGVLNVATKTPYHFDTEEINLLSLIGNQIAVAIENARLHAEIKESEEKYKTLVEDINDGYFLCQDGEILYTNDAFLSMHGYGREEVAGSEFREFLYREYMPHVERVLRDGARGKGIPEHIEFKRKNRDGKKLPTELKINLIAFRGRPALIGIFRDISKRKEMERKVMDSQRLASIGQLSASIAHEIRNPLSAIKTNIQVLSKTLNLEGFDKRRLEIASGEIRRLDRILEDILDFAAPVKLARVDHDIRGLIEKSIELLGEKIKEADIRVIRKMSHPIPKLSMNYEKMQQAILNLILNAIDAMPNGGTLVFATGLSMRLGRKAVRVEIKDNGLGISSEHLENIFDPFFSAKTQGTGLGLSNVKKIIEAHDGSIQVVSRPRYGTRMRLLLPLE